MSESLLSIIVIAHNEQEHIGKCLDAVVSQARSVSFKTEIIVIDNLSTDMTKSIVQSFPVQYFYEQQPGPSQARNRGWRESKGDLLLFLDGDCIIQESLFESVFRCFDDPIIDACTSNVIHYSDSKAISKFMNEHVQRNINFSLKNQQGLFSMMNGAASMGFRRVVVDELGGFANKYIAGEDTEISWRLIYENRQIVFLDDICVHHLTKASMKEMFSSQYFRYGYIWRLMREWDQVFRLFNIDAGKEAHLLFSRFCGSLRRSWGSPDLPVFQDRVDFFFLVTGHFLKLEVDAFFVLVFGCLWHDKKERSFLEAQIERKIFSFSGKRFSLCPDVKFKVRKRRIVFHRPKIKDLFYVDDVGRDFLRLFFLNIDSNVIAHELCAAYEVDRDVLVKDLFDLLGALVEGHILYVRDPA